VYPQVFGKYVLERELSRGGMARVVLATLRGAGGFEKKLVVKQIRDELAYDQQFVRRFVEEAKTTVALSHPNIVPVYELGVEQGTYFLAMELVEGVSIAELLRGDADGGNKRVLSPEEGAYLGVEVCRALDYAHRRMKVVHRDITPRNVMVDEEGQIKLIDFGIAAPALVAGHEILGSPGHMAPEQVDGGELGPPTDIFALAVLLLEAWTGSPPFRRGTPEECAAALRDPHPRPGDFDPRLRPLDAAMARAMSIDPQKRQQEAGELGRELRAFLKGVDLADVARALGDRVRDLRLTIEAEGLPSRTSGQRPSVASHAELGTKTFAARDEALSWPRVAAAPISEPLGPSTRQLPGSAPSLDAARPAALDVPTPLLVDADELDAIHSEIARSSERPRQADIPTVRRPRIDRAAAAVEAGRAGLETIATRPIEAPVERPPPAAGDGRRVPRPFGPAAVGALAALVALGGLVLWRSGAPGSRASPTQPPAPPASIATAAPAPSIAPAAALAEAPASAAPPPASSGSAPPAPAAQAAARASLVLVGDPGTRVAIDGAPRGACPTKAALEPGAHEVRFTFEPTGETLGERVTVKGGEHVTVRATFTGATPTVKVTR
jgi:serine/threonine-protein kinase